VRYRRIVGLSNTAATPSHEALVRMASTLTHRGPDELGVYRDDRAGLAHARLSIIDLSSGQQPMADEGETSWIVFNGEIFNYVELREELVALGHRFRTQSDTEVILHAHRAWGDAAFARFNGQWAVALWDSLAGRLVLSRDRVGICRCMSANIRAACISPAKSKPFLRRMPTSRGPLMHEAYPRLLPSGPSCHRREFSMA